MEACERLVDTGLSQITLLSVGVLVISAALALIFFGNRYSIKTLVLVVGVLFSLTFISSPAISFAQAVEDDCPTEVDNDEGTAVLSLVDDQGVIQLPDEDSSTTTIYMAILNNDQHEAGDPIDWETVDLDPDTPGIQSSIALMHPDDEVDDYYCGSITVESFGILSVSLSFNCFDGEFDASLEIPLDYTIAPFAYTAQTLGGTPATAPATVTVIVEADIEASIVLAENDHASEFGDCGVFESFSFNVLTNDSTSEGSLVASTVDLNPSRAGVQSSVNIVVDGTVFTASVNGAGLVTVTNVSENGEAPPVFFYTVENSNGGVSNVAAITWSCEGIF